MRAIPRLNERQRDRFLSLILKGDGCWEWRGLRAKSGHGIFSANGVNLLAHRVSMEFHGTKIPEGMCVCHRCDNPPCVRPDHLFIGTQLDNIRDMNEKGRAVFIQSQPGEKHHNAKFTDAQVEEARRLRSMGKTQWAIARRFGVHQATVWRWLNGYRPTRLSSSP